MGVLYTEGRGTAGRWLGEPSVGVGGACGLGVWAEEAGAKADAADGMEAMCGDPAPPNGRALLLEDEVMWVEFVMSEEDGMEVVMGTGLMISTESS